jgi:signal transduction histidine kinase/DNA-binding response OmpR family regulator
VKGHGASQHAAVDIFIVEDSPTQALQLQHILEQHGYHCSVAENGREALALMRRNKPAAVISDILMPEMDGYQLCRQIKTDADLTDIPVILLTSLADPRDVIRGLECGADNFIVKPYDEQLLLSRIQYILTNQRIRRGAKTQTSLKIVFAGQTYVITANRLQILNLLLSTYETAVQQNRQLTQTQEALQQLNIRLEDMVAERTAALQEEIAERRRVGEALRRSAERLRVLRDIDRAILTAQSPKAIAQGALSHIHALIPCWRVGISLFDWQAHEGLVLASIGHDTPRLSAGTSISMEDYGLQDLAILLTNQAYLVADVLTLTAPPVTVCALRDEGLRSYMRVPLTAQGALLGALNLWSDRPDTFTAEHVEIAREVADQLAIGIQQSRLHEQVQHHALELERRVAERTTELQEMNAELETFSYSVAHDLRAPLRSLHSFAQILLEGYSDVLDAEGRDYAQRIVAAARRLDALTHDLLTYSRLGRAAMVLESVNLEEVVEEVLTELEVEIRNKTAHVTVDRPLPPVLGHSTSLMEVVSNLLMNGLKFVAPDIRPQVRIWATERDEWVRLWIQDNGIGIAPEYHERIFGVFERLHGVDAYPGTGIGLAIVRKSMERMGGRVGVESALGQGSTFWVEFAKYSGGRP